MLFSEEREKHPILILKDVSFDALKNVIDFVYRGEIQIPKGDLKTFLELAESLQIKGLNDFSMKDVCEPFICDASSDVCQDPSSDNQKDTFEARSLSVSHASTDSSVEQPPLYHSYGYSDAVQINPSPSFEKSNRAHEKETSILEMALSQGKNVPVLPSENSEDTEIKVKEELLQPECVVVKSEQIDECDELMQEDNSDDSEECGAPPFPKQNLDEYPTIASTHTESASVVPDAVRVPQMIRPPIAQGVASTYMASTSGLPDAVRIPQMIGPAKTPVAEHSVCRRELFELWQWRDRKSGCIELYNYTVQKLNIQQCSKGAERYIKNVLHSFVARMKRKWGKCGRHLERFVLQNEAWLAGSICFPESIFTE